MGVQDQLRRRDLEPHIVDTVMLMRAFLKITDPADRRKIIEVAEVLARSAPPVAPH